MILLYLRLLQRRRCRTMRTTTTTTTTTNTTTTTTTTTTITTSSGIARISISGFQFWRPTWRHGSTSVQPVDVFWSYRVTVSARTTAGLLLWLARRPGTLSRINSGIRTLLYGQLQALVENVFVLSVPVQLAH